MAKRRSPGEGRVEKLPSGRWRAILPGRERGGRSKTFDTQADARDWLRRNAAKKATPAGTVGDWLTEWLALVKSEAAASTYSRDKNVIERHLRPRLGEIRLRDLDSTRIKTHLGELKDAGMSDSERHRVAATLRKILNAAVPDRLDTSPMDGRRVKMPTVERIEWKAFTIEQIQAFIAAADALGVGGLMRLWFDSGVRVGEFLGLKWSDYEPETRILHIRRAVCPRTAKLKLPKSKRTRRVLLSEETVKHMPTPRAPELPMVTGHERESAAHRAIGNFTRGTWKRLLKDAGLTGLKLTPKSVRHSTATHLLRAGCSLRAVADRLGHRDPSLTLRIYAHVMPSDQGALADMMGTMLAPPPIPHDSPRLFP